MLDLAQNQTVSTIDCPETVLLSLQSGMLGESELQNLTFTLSGKLVYPTAVKLDDDTVVCLFGNMESSIPADDTSRTPRADAFYHGEGSWQKAEKLEGTMAKKIVGVAAYRVVQSREIQVTSQQRAIETVGV